MRILHILRAPVGGLFRHVRDLAREQARAGHEVGIICDTGGGEAATQALAQMVDHLAMGVTRLPIPRLPGPADLQALGEIRERIRLFRPHVVHGHGAKGGLHARLAARGNKTVAVYTPHGGSLHYAWNSLAGMAFLSAERWLLRHTDGLLFVCRFEQETFFAKVGRPACPHAVVHNGLREDEFRHVPLNEDAADFLFIGEMRALKGVDVLVGALRLMHMQGHRVRACLVGDGPDRQQFAELVSKHELGDFVEMPGAMPAQEAFRRGRIVVVPSRAESFPYVVLEAQAAARPVIATAVGGIPEMLPEDALVPPEDAEMLAARMTHMLYDPQREQAAAERMEEMRQRFSCRRMAEDITAFYQRLPLRA